VLNIPGHSLFVLVASETYSLLIKNLSITFTQQLPVTIPFLQSVRC